MDEEITCLKVDMAKIETKLENISNKLDDHIKSNDKNFDALSKSFGSFIEKQEDRQYDWLKYAIATGILLILSYILNSNLLHIGLLK